jgi:hypothetical protein
MTATTAEKPPEGSSNLKASTTEQQHAQHLPVLSRPPRQLQTRKKQRCQVRRGRPGNHPDARKKPLQASSSSPRSLGRLEEARNHCRSAPTHLLPTAMAGREMQGGARLPQPREGNAWNLIQTARWPPPPASRAGGERGRKTTTL